jgi:hypothetical protein
MRRCYVYALLVLAAACGGDSHPGGGDAPIDNPMAIDAPVDMMVVTQMGLGQSCTPVAGMIVQSDCPTGLVCLKLNGGMGAFCTKTCTPAQPDPCQMGYTGVGLAQCHWSVMDGNTTQMYCGIICQDMSSGHMTCAPSICNGTCPSQLACKLPPSGTGELKLCY